MDVSSQQYAHLAADAYRTPRLDNPDDMRVTFEGVDYAILEHMDRRTGYQGTIYQRPVDGQVIVAHRGTEADKGAKALLQDGALADGGMVLSRSNLQIADAVELTRRALVYGKQAATEYGHAPEVTVTGHSLGGTLAQITAHHFGLRGETFNAYGAASLQYGIPEGGDRVVNHVMAGDAINAASGHYGDVHHYATPDGVRRLAGAGGYANDERRLDLRNPLAATSLEPHYMHNFLDVDGSGRHDISVLRDPRAQQLAAQHRPMFDKYRSDIELLRASATAGAALARGPGGVLDEARHRFGPRRPPGDGGREALEPTDRLPSSPLSRPSPWPLRPPRFDGPSGLYRELPGTAWPDTRSSDRPQPGEPLSARIDGMLDAARSGDDERFRAGLRQLADCDAAHDMRAGAIAAAEREEQLAAQQLAGRQMQDDAVRQHHGPRLH